MLQQPIDYSSSDAWNKLFDSLEQDRKYQDELKQRAFQQGLSTSAEARAQKQELRNQGIYEQERQIKGLALKRAQDEESFKGGLAALSTQPVTDYRTKTFDKEVPYEPVGPPSPYGLGSLEHRLVREDQKQNVPNLTAPSTVMQITQEREPFTRPPTQDEQLKRAMNYALQSGNIDSLSQIAHVTQITDKGSIDMLNKIHDGMSKLMASGATFDSAKKYFAGLFPEYANKIMLWEHNPATGGGIVVPLTDDEDNVMGYALRVGVDKAGNPKYVNIANPMTMADKKSWKEAEVAALQSKAATNRMNAVTAASKLDPMVMAKVEGAKTYSEKTAEALKKDESDYVGALQAVSNLDRVDEILKKRDPAELQGWLAEFKQLAGRVHPELQRALDTGDKSTLQRIAKDSINIYKSSFAPNITNSDIENIFELTGSKATDYTQLKESIKQLRIKNNTVIGSYEKKLRDFGILVPEVSGAIERPVTPTRQRPAGIAPPTIPRGKSSYDAAKSPARNKLEADFPDEVLSALNKPGTPVAVKLKSGKMLSITADEYGRLKSEVR